MFAETDGDGGGGCMCMRGCEDGAIIYPGNGCQRVQVEGSSNLRQGGSSRGHAQRFGHQY